MKSIIKSIAFILLLFTTTVITAQELSEEKMKRVTYCLCKDITDARLDGIDVPTWEDTMRTELGYTGTKADFPKYFNNFLNNNKQKLICPAIKDTILPTQHFYKRILAAGMNEAYEEYFFNFNDGDVDFNAYEIVDGKKETVLDWVHKWIASNRGDKDELIDVTEVLADEFGALKGSEL